MSTAHMHGPPPGQIGRRSPWGYFCMMSYKHGIFSCSQDSQSVGGIIPLLVLGCAGCWLLARWRCPSSSSRLGIVIHFPVYPALTWTLTCCFTRFFPFLSSPLALRSPCHQFPSFPSLSLQSSHTASIFRSSTLLLRTKPLNLKLPNPPLFWRPLLSTPYSALNFGYSLVIPASTAYPVWGCKILFSSSVVSQWEWTCLLLFKLPTQT